jgi:hypothetical protein
MSDCVRAVLCVELSIAILPKLRDNERYLMADHFRCH